MSKVRRVTPIGNAGLLQCEKCGDDIDLHEWLDIESDALSFTVVACDRED